MTNEELVEQLGKVIDAKLDEKLEPINKRLDTVEKNIATRQDVAEVRQEMATKADVQDIKADLVKQQRRIENLEEHTKTSNPHKN